MTSLPLALRGHAPRHRQRRHPALRVTSPGPAQPPHSGALWRQPPVYSPLPLRAVLGAIRQTYLERTDPLPTLRALLRERYRADAVDLLDSGTQALQLALRAAGRISGLPLTVALPAYGCFDIAAAAVGAGADILLYDLDPTTLSPDLDSLAVALASGARVVVIAPLFGVPVPWQEIEECARQFDAVLVEDAAQGHGATWNGLPLGSYGQVSTLSFGRGKGWTGVRGGALLLRGPARPPLSAIRRPAGGAHSLGIVFAGLAQSALAQPRWYGLPASIPWLHLGETRYRRPLAPRTIDPVAAGVITRTFPFAMREARLRRGVALDLLQRLPSGRLVRAITGPAQGDADPGFLRLPVLLPGGLGAFPNPDQALRIGLAPGYPDTLASLAPVRARLLGPPTHWPGAEELRRQLVTLPTHSRLTVHDRDVLLFALRRLRA